jgi:hypothetical protein
VRKANLERRKEQRPTPRTRRVCARQVHSPTLTLLFCLCLLLLPGLLGAVEIHSNGRGGGDWSDPDTWHGGLVPTAQDTVVIAMRDTVAVDQDHSEQISCLDLYLDPEGVLSFKPGRETRALTVAGSIECYGIIRLDATGSSRQEMRLQFLGDVDHKTRQIILMKQSSLFVYGHERTRPEARNAFIGGVSLAPDQPAPLVTVKADDQIMVDIQHGTVAEVLLELSHLDNTNATAGERLNLIENHFTGNSRALLTACDTPTVRGNLFELGDATNRETPLRIDGCSLAEIRNNTLKGKWLQGIWVTTDTDSAASGNLISGPDIGLQWAGTNAMVKENAVSDCGTGYSFHSTTGTIENCLAKNCPAGISLQSSTMQLTQCQVIETPAKGAPLALQASSVTLLNCNLSDDQILLKGGAPKGASAWVENLVYLVVRVKGKVPPGAEVLVETSAVSGGVPDGKADLNVRNSPAPLNDTGWTPLPGTRRALVLRSWQMGLNGKRVNAPFYDLKVLAPAAGTAKRKVLYNQRIEPSDSWNWGGQDQPIDGLGTTAETLHLLTWAAPDSAAATVEITLPGACQ